MRWVLVVLFSLLLAPSANAATVNQTGYWAFDEAAGTTAANGAGGRAAMLSGSATWGPGFKGYGLVLNGTPGTYADVAEPVIDATKSFSVSVRVKLNRVDQFQTMVSVDGTQASGFFLQLRPSNGGEFAFVRVAQDAAIPDNGYPGAPGVTAGRWYMVTGVYDASAGSLSLYVDDQRKGTTAAPPVWKAAGHLAIGRALWGAFTDWVNGTIDEVRTFDGALSASQIAELYETGTYRVIVDDDGDNTSVPLDCNDANASIHPGAVDVPGDGIDQDCSGADALVDADGDGFPAAADCNDGSAAINRNAAELAGNGVDENCDGVAAIAPMTATVRSDWAAKRTTRVNTLLVRNAPANTTVELRCRGRGCPFKSRGVFARAGGNVNLRASLRKAKLRPGAVVEVRVAAPFTVGKVARFTIRRERTPLTAYLCLPPGATAPTRCA